MINQGLKWGISLRQQLSLFLRLFLLYTHESFTLDKFRIILRAYIQNMVSLRMKSKRSRLGNFPIVSAILIVLIVAIFAVIGIVVIAGVENTVTHSEISTEASTAINETFDAVYDAWGLWGVVIIVVIASVILGSLLVLGRGGA